MEEKRRVLVIGAHKDECEFCCSGLTLLLLENSFRVFFLNTIGDSSYWSTFGPEKNAKSVEEAKEVAKILGAEKILLPFVTERNSYDVSHWINKKPCYIPLLEVMKKADVTGPWFPTYNIHSVLSGIKIDGKAFTNILYEEVIIVCEVIEFTRSIITLNNSFKNSNFIIQG